MALPDSCELTATHLDLLGAGHRNPVGRHRQAVEFCCTVACTNALRPLGPVEVVQQAIPDLSDGELLQWGSRHLAADAGHSYAEAGYVLCQLRLPVQSMGSPVPPGVSVGRPAGS